LKNVIILGLPEKYGTSMDFVLLADKNNWNVTIVDDRAGRLTMCREVLGTLVGRALIHRYPRIVSIDSLPTFRTRVPFDLVLSCEVLQRFSPVERRQYAEAVSSLGHNAIIFVPNKDNKAHAQISKLQALTLDDLKELFKDSNVMNIGYVDLPPFPPGLKARRNAGTRRNGTLLRVVLMKVLVSWLRLEQVMPSCVKRKYSHIAFVYVHKSE
jgi:hypothetical protein